MAGMGHSITIPRLLVEFTLCRDPYTTFLDELKEAFVSAAGWLHSQIDAVFALGKTKDNRKIRKYLQHFFPNKVQFEQTDAEQRNSAIMEKWRMYEQLLAAAAWFSDSQWKCASFVWNNKHIELRYPKKFAELLLTTCKY